MKEYKKIVKHLSPFFEAHHLDLHEQFHIVLKNLARIEAKLDRLESKEFIIVDEVELDPAKIEKPVAKIQDVLEDPCTDKECEDEIADLYKLGGTE